MSSAGPRSSATIAIGASSWAPAHIARVAPTSATVSSASSSRWSTRARCSWSRQRIRNSVLVDQSVVSKARRAAATAASASATVASGAWPTTSSVAGLTEGNVRGVSTSSTVDQHPPIGVAASDDVTRDGRRFRHPPQLSLCDGNFILIFGESYIRRTRTQENEDGLVMCPDDDVEATNACDNPVWFVLRYCTEREYGSHNRKG